MGSNNTSDWSLSGEISYDENFPEIEFSKAGVESAGGQYFEILDANGKIIFRFFPLLNIALKQTKFIANNVVVTQNSQAVIAKEIAEFQPFTIKLKNGKLFFSFAAFAEKQLPVFDASANSKSPATVRFYFWAKGKGANRVVSFKNFEFNAE